MTKETKTEQQVRDEAMNMTLDHVNTVARKLMEVVTDIQGRAIRHDRSKFSDEEFGTFARETHALKGLTYGSDEYKAALARMEPALLHHYYKNRHHPEYWAMDDIGSRIYEDQVKSGQAIESMNLIDLLEMLADWKAATMRHDDGDLRKSIEMNAERFGYDDKMKRLLTETARYMGWLS